MKAVADSNIRKGGLADKLFAVDETVLKQIANVAQIQINSPLSQRGTSARELMWSFVIVMHLPQTVLIPAVFATGKSDLMKTFVIICAIASFDDPVSPRTCPFDQSVDSVVFFDDFGKCCFSFRMSGVFHRETHRIIGKSYEKGGRLSNAL